MFIKKILLIHFCLLLCRSYIAKFNSLYQYAVHPYKIDLANFTDEYCNIFGLWSRYNPLSNITQVGDVGIFDSNCFHLFSIREQTNSEPNFIQYDCLDFILKSIRKVVTFIGSDKTIYKFEIPINIDEYESTWYFFNFIIIPGDFKFIFSILQQTTMIYNREVQLLFPFKDVNLNIIIGGGLSVTKNQALYSSDTSKLSYFPGQFLQLKPAFQNKNELSCDYSFMQKEAEQLNYECRCNEARFQLQPLANIENFDQEFYRLEIINCKTSRLQSWIRLIDINAYKQIIEYQLIKLCMNTESLKLISDNLSQFQLFYKLSRTQNKLIITSYSYTFPQVNIDFQNNPFLIKKEFDLNHNISLWHYLLFQKTDTSILVEIVFYDGYQQYQYFFEQTVNQFQNVQFQIKYGNLLKCFNCLNVQMRDFEFTNCATKQSFENYCHKSCKECDGPTKSNCLSCETSSNRIYIKEFKSCICPYGYFDFDDCIDYTNLELNLEQSSQDGSKCPYSYFEFDDNCFRWQQFMLNSPSLIRETQVTCIECLMNPKGWIINPYCEYYYSSVNTSSPFELNKEVKKYYFFDGTDLRLCYYCNVEIEISEDSIVNTATPKPYCQFYDLEQLQEECWKVVQSICSIFEIQIHMPICRGCRNGFDLENFGCIIYNYQPLFKLICETPYYTNYLNQCTLCPIKKCLWCFEYNVEDTSINTLSFRKIIFESDDHFQVGCAQCESGFIYDFIIKECKQQEPSIQNCLKSYISLKNQEVCTLSSIDDFNIAPQIINCQKYIDNCEECFETFEKILKCIICQDGYFVSTITGLCFIFNEINTAKQYTCSTQDKGVSLVINQAFSKTFQNSNILVASVDSQYTLCPLKCLDGYQLYSHFCAKYCDSNCQVCQKAYQTKRKFIFTCSQCQFNYYKQISRTADLEKCLNCPPLCKLCQQRSVEQILEINKYFQISEENTKYSTICLQSISSPNIYIDPDLKIARYCYNNQCNFIFEQQINSYQSLPGYQSSQLHWLQLFEYSNHIGLKMLAISLKSQDICYIESFIFKQKIFSLQLIILRIQGIFQNSEQTCLITDFDEIEFNNFQMLLQSDLTLKLQHSQKALNLKIIDFSLSTIQEKPLQIQISIFDCSYLLVNHLFIVNISIDNSNLFNLSYESNQNQTLISNLEIQNSIFTNSVLFNFMNVQEKFEIEYLIIDGSQFENSTIFNFFSNQNYSVWVIIKKVIIKNSLFRNSNLIQNSKNILLKLEFFQFFQNKFFNCELININQKTLAIDFQLNLNNFFQSILFNLKSSIELQINKIQAKQNQFQNFSILNTKKQTSDFNNITLTNINIEDNIYYEDLSQHMFIIISYTISIYNVSIINTYNQRYFYLQNALQIMIQNISCKNDIQQLKIPLQLECLKNFRIHSQLIFIQGFQQLEIEDVQISNQQTFDIPLIEITSSTIQIKQFMETIKITNLFFFGNNLLKISKGNLFSQLTIHSEKEQLIELENIKYQENAFNQFIVDPLESSSSLLYINSFLSSIVANQITSFKNSNTNSTNSFIQLFSNSIKMTNIQVSYHNYIEIDFWNKYYDLYFQDIFTQSQINILMQQSYTFKNQGGVMKINADNFTLINGIFQYVIAQSSSLFKIISSGNGIMLISNCSFLFAENMISKNFESNGALTIDSRSSFLSLKLTDCSFIEIENKFAPSIFSIYPSPYKNKIIIKNFQIENCYSLQNSFIELNSRSYNNDGNQFLIENIKFINTVDKLHQFHKKLEYFEPFLLQQIINNNAIINIIGFKVQISNLSVQGILIFPLIKILDCPRVALINFQISGLQIYFPFSMIQIEQSELNLVAIQIKNMIIQNITMGIASELALSYIIFPSLQQLTQKCNIINYVINSNYSKEFNSYQNLLEIIQQLNYQEGSFIYLKSSSNNTKINISSLQFLNNDCKTCWNGLMYFYLIDFSFISIKELTCINNFIKQYGCIKALAQTKQNQKIEVKQSDFISNQGTHGTAIYSNNAKIFLSNSRILNNSANMQGGGLYLQLSIEDFRIQNTIIINNKARLGGGIYLDGTNQLQTTNFIQSLLILNIALVSASNIQESASHLDLNINDKKMMFYTRVIDNNSIRILNINPYKIISQGITFYTNVLIIPSNQQIQMYEIYDVRIQKYLSYINNISITFKNQMDEQVRISPNTKCYIKQKSYNQSTGVELEASNVSLVQFDREDDKLNLGSQIFIFDPNQQNNKTYEISIQCEQQDKESLLLYNLQVKSFFCQLGEFYSQEGCQVCQSSQGFYSVTYNTTKCSIFDKNKFETISSNNLQLKVGYWRPNYLSDIIDACFKNTKFCKGGWVVGDQLCILGHLGGLCEQCDKYNVLGNGFYFQDQQTLKCYQCKDLINNIMPLILMLFWVLIINIITVMSIQNTNKRFSYYQLNQRFGYILFKLNLDQESILLKLFFNYIWIFSLIFTFNIDLSFNFVSRTNDTSYFLASNFDCQLTESFNFELIYSRVIIAVVLMVMQLIFIQIGFNMHSLISEGRINSNIISITALHLFIQNFASLIKQLLSIAAKRSISNLDYIQGDVSLLYGHGNHLSWIIIFVIPSLTVIIIILPLSLLIMLYLNKKNLNKIKLRRHIGYLMNEYNTKTFYWEWIRLWKKTIIIILLIIFETQVVLKGSFIGITLVSYYLFASKFQPYINQKLNKLDVQSGQFCLLAINLALAKYICDQQEIYSYSQIIQFLIFLICTILSYPFIYSIVVIYFRKYQLIIGSALLLLLKKLQFCKKLSLILKVRLESQKQCEQRVKRNFQMLKKHYFSKKQQRNQGQKIIFTQYSTLTRYPQINTECDLEEQVKMNLQK